MRKAMNSILVRQRSNSAARGSKESPGSSSRISAERIQTVEVCSISFLRTGEGTSQQEPEVWRSDFLGGGREEGREQDV